MYPDSDAKTSGYDRVATMFSPKGRLYQVEYASKIVEQGTLGVGLVYNKGVLLAADKNIVSSLVIAPSIEKLFKVDEHIGAVSSGLVGDARRLVKIARQKCQENRMLYDEKIQVDALVKEIASVNQLFTQYAGMRPFGISLIIGGIYAGKAQVFETEPAGALAEYNAVAIGQGKKKAMEMLEKEYKVGLTLEKAIKLALKIINATSYEKRQFDVNNVCFAFIEEGKPFEMISSDKLQTYL